MVAHLAIAPMQHLSALRSCAGLSQAIMCHARLSEFANRASVSDMSYTAVTPELRPVRIEMNPLT